MAPKSHAHLIGWEGQLLEEQPPAFAVDPLALSSDKIGVEDRLDSVLQTRQLRDQLRTLSNTSPFQLDRLRRYPDFRQELCRVQTRERCRIDLVSLDLRPGDRAHLQWIGDSNPAHKRREQAYDDGSIASRLDYDVVFFGQGAGELENCFAVHCDPTVVLNHAILQNGDLRKRPMNIQADDSHRGLQR